MIQCFKVICKDKKQYFDCETQRIKTHGNFITEWVYIAKISCNDSNIFAVLDNDGNWVPFRSYSTWGCYIDGVLVNDEYSFKHYFDIQEFFLIKNKKELNKLILSNTFTTNYYKNI